MSVAYCRGGPLNGQQIIVRGDRFEVEQPAQTLRVLERDRGAEKEINFTRGLYEKGNRISGDGYIFSWKGWTA